MPRRRAWPAPPCASSRLAALGLDAAALGLLGFAALAGPWSLLVAPAGWGLFRLRGLWPWLVEGALRLRFWLGWSWDWLAEAFNPAAARRLAAREAARAVLRVWRRRAARLPGLPDRMSIEAFLDEGYGPAAGAAWRQHAASLSPAASRRLDALWRTALLRGFRGVAATGVFWTSRPAAAPPPAVQTDPAADAARAARAARRAEVQEALRKRRQEVDTAHGWKLKTPAELAERDRHLGELRRIIAALEAELKAL